MPDILIEKQIKSLEARIASLEATVRSMKALAHGPKGDDGRDGKDGKDGRDGKVIRDQAPSAQTPIQVNYERPAPTIWCFETDAKGRTIAKPITMDVAL